MTAVKAGARGARQLRAAATSGFQDVQLRMVPFGGSKVGEPAAHAMLLPWSAGQDNDARQVEEAGGRHVFYQYDPNRVEDMWCYESPGFD